MSKQFWDKHLESFQRYIYDEYKATILEDEIVDLSFQSFEKMFFKQILLNYKQLHGITKQYKSRKYLITFTYNPNSGYTKESFKQAVIKQLNRKTIEEAHYAFEHEETNIHCHALVTSTHPLSKANFHSHSRKYGNIDLKSVQNDNGIIDYISKETSIFSIIKEPSTKCEV